MKILMPFLFSLFIAFQSFAGGPWTQEKQSGIFISNINPVIYQTRSSSNGSGISLPRRISDIGLHNYFEYGISNSFTLIGSLEFKYVGSSRKTFDSNFINPIENGQVFGLGNSSLGLKYNVTENKFLFSLSYAFEFPAVGNNVLNGLRTGIPSWGFVPSLQIGQGFDNGIYYYFEGVFVARNQWSHEWRLNAEIGYNFKKPLTLALYISVKESLKNKAIIESSFYQQTGLFLNNQEFIAWSFKLSRELNNQLGLNLGFSGGFRTELIARTPVISAGFYWKWHKTLEL